MVAQNYHRGILFSKNNLTEIFRKVFCHTKLSFRKGRYNDPTASNQEKYRIHLKNKSNFPQIFYITYHTGVLL